MELVCSITSTRTLLANGAVSRSSPVSRLNLRSSLATSASYHDVSSRCSENRLCYSRLEHLDVQVFSVIQSRERHVARIRESRLNLARQSERVPMERSLKFGVVASETRPLGATVARHRRRKDSR